MISLSEKLTILYYSGVSYAEYSKELSRYNRDQVTLTVASTDKIYIGFQKPINTFFLELNQASSTATDLNVKYWDGSQFSDVSNLYDDSMALMRSAFINWDRNQTTEAKTTIDGTELYWYELSVDQDTTEIVIDGLNIVFSDDEDLKREVPDITTYTPSGATSFILSHVAARDEIIQRLRTDGRFKVNLGTGYLEDLTAFDLLDVSQVKMASTYLTLAKIYDNISDQIDDIYRQKSDIFRGQYNSAMNHFWLFIDGDDDGALDNEERLQNVNPMIYRR